MSKYKRDEDLQSIMSNLQPNCCLKVDFQKVDQHIGGKWSIHDTNCNVNWLFGLRPPCLPVPLPHNDCGNTVKHGTQTYFTNDKVLSYNLNESMQYIWGIIKCRSPRIPVLSGSFSDFPTLRGYRDSGLYKDRQRHVLSFGNQWCLIIQDSICVF